MGNDTHYVDFNMIEQYGQENNYMPALEILKNFICEAKLSYIKDGKINVEQLDEWIDNLEELDKGNTFNIKIPTHIIEERKEQLREYLYRMQDTGEFTDEIFDVVCKVITESEDGNISNNENMNKLLSHIVSKTEVLSKIQSYSMVQEQIDELKLEKKDLSSQIELLKLENEERSEEYRKQAEKNIENELSAKDKALNELVFEIENKEKQLVEICEKYSKYEKLDQIEDRVNNLSGYEKVIKEEVQELEEKLKNLRDEYEEKVDRIIDEKYIKDKSEMLQVKNKMKYDEDAYLECVKCVNELEASFEYENFGNYVTSQIQKVRDYDSNDIINIFACIYTGFLTVFSGEPGTGKTSICNIIAKVLGLNEFGEHKKINLNKYIPISVERGWTSKRDFLGYYNPLTKEFDKSNKHLFDGLSIQHYDEENKFPTIVLLDEANLSPMEYYWGDFMKICDMDKDGSKELNLGNDTSRTISDKLRFLATINNDHTTEILSPRLVDRAWIINLPEVKSIKESILLESEIIPWVAVENYFTNNKVKVISRAIIDALNRIQGMLKQLDVNISIRSRLLIEEYIKITVPIFGDDNLKALDYAILQKALPMINGSGELFLESLKELEREFSQRQMKKSEEMIGKIIAKGNASMMYYNYFN